MTLFQALKATKIPVAYGHFKEGQTLPFMVYYGNGQDVMYADNKYYHKENTYELEYYFEKKNEKAEDKLEQAILDAGYRYSKASDTFIQGENVYVIYYDIRK